MAILSRRLSSLVLIAVGMFALVACQSDPDTPVIQAPPNISTIVANQPTIAPTTTPMPVPTLESQPTFSAPPDLNRDIHSVDLDNIIFDTFDGSSKRLSAESNDLIDRLRDAIKPVYSAHYDDASAADWLAPNDLILGYVSERGQAYAYPIKFLNFHELVNDVIDGGSMAKCWCSATRVRSTTPTS